MKSFATLTSVAIANVTELYHRSQTIKYFMTLSIVVVLALGAQANSYNMDGYNGEGVSSFNTSADWENDEAPVAGNDYFINGKLMRSPDYDSTTDMYVFAGDSLTLNGNGIFAWKSSGACVITNFIIDSGSIQHWKDGTLGRIHGRITINPGKLFDLQVTGDYKRSFAIYSEIYGEDLIQVTFNKEFKGTDMRASFLGDNSGFTGKFRARGIGQLGLTDEKALGSNPPAFTEDQLSLRGAAVLITNSLAIDDPNRGIKLEQDSFSSLSVGGGFEITGSNTATVSCVISGDYNFFKRGSGTLVLTTNELYTGTTLVEEGTLHLTPNASLLSSGINVTGSASAISGSNLTDITLTAGGTLEASQAGCNVQSLDVQDGWFYVDLSEANPDTPLIRMSGPLSKAAFEVFKFKVNTNNTTETAYKILSAPNLSDFDNHDFGLDVPWMGELSLIDDGSGGQVLVFTPTPPEKIEFQQYTDVFGKSALIDTNWSSYLAPSAGNTYVVNKAVTMRTPTSGNVTFAGKRLILNGDYLQSFLMKGAGTPTIDDLRVMNHSVFSLGDNPAGRIAGNITLHSVLSEGKSYALRVQSMTILRDFYMYSALHGYGELRLYNEGNPEDGYAQYFMSALNTNFFGRIYVQGNTNFTMCITCEENIGGEPPAFREDQMLFNGGGISVTNNVTLDDANRGIMLSATGGWATTSSDEGGFPSGTPESERRFEGGAVLRVENAATLNITCPVTGPGGFTKAGEGQVILGGANSYTGLTTIINGTLCPISSDAFGTGPVNVRDTGRLLRRYPELTLPNGVELGGPINFSDGGAVRVALEEGLSAPGNFTLPLFLLAEGETIDPMTVPVEHNLPNYVATVTTSTVGTRVVVSAQLSYQGTLIMLR
ncbi:MAG: autotransporter-associated beta strand repeat-containing protein [Kiritimatiellia bacterium]